MALSWNEIRSRAIVFTKEWEDESRENAESQSFWNDFFQVFGVSRRRVATFEKPVEKLGDKKGSIDLLWKGVILVEHKSRGKDLDKAFAQAKDYFPGIKESMTWHLYWIRGNGKKELYSDLKPQKDLQKCIDEINEDPLCTFWG